MTTLHSAPSPTTGASQRERRLPRTQQPRHAATAPVTTQANERSDPVRFAPPPDFDDEDWICCRSID